MSDFTDEQLKRVEAAFCKTVGAESKGVCAATGIDFDNFMAELRPAPKFAEGQVLYDKEDGYYFVASSWQFRVASGADLGMCRPLTLTEHGPAVRDLRDEVKYWAGNPGIDEEVSQFLWDALAAFDKEISDD